MAGLSPAADLQAMPGRVRAEWQSAHAVRCMTDDITGPDPLGPDGWDGQQPMPPADQVDWTPMLELLPAVDERRDAPPDPPQEPFKKNADGVRIIDFSSLTSPVAGELSWVAQETLSRSGFDWGSFVDSPRGRLIVERINAGDPGDLTLEECRMLLLALARQERFSDGAIDSAIRSGFVSVVLRRAADLVGG